MTEEKIADAVAVTPKGNEMDNTDKGTLKDEAESKRDRESTNNLPFKSPAAKKKIALDDTVAEAAEVRISTLITLSFIIIAFSHTHTLTDIC